MKKLVLYIFVVILFLINSCEKEEIEQINSLIEVSKSDDNSPLEKSDTIGLPQTVKKYFEFTGVEGVNRVRFVKFKTDGKLKLTTNGKWLDGYAEEYLTIPNPSRNWIAEIKQSALITAYAHETYIEGEGENTVEFFAPSKFQISHGKEYDISGLVTYLDDLILAPTALFSDKVNWNHLTDSTAALSISDCGLTVSATCFFDESGCISKLTSSDRYRAVDDGAVQTDWTTIFKNYRQFNGLNIPTTIEYIWHLKNEDFVYAKVNIKEVSYDEFSMY